MDPLDNVGRNSAESSSLTSDASSNAAAAQSNSAGSATQSQFGAFNQTGENPSLAHAVYEKVAGTAESTMGSLTGNKSMQTEGTARSTTAGFEMDAAQGKNPARN
ncbi:hypothetical protein RI367_002083 [Sorochytrium milnesiophthora]